LSIANGEPQVLTAVQSRILLSLFLNGGLSSSSLLKLVGMSGTCWSKERRFLTGAGLLNYVVRRELTDKGVLRKTEFTLTQKGVFVTQNLLAISASLCKEDNFTTANSKQPDITKTEIKMPALARL